MNDSDFIAYENHRLTVANAELRKERDELEHRIKRLEEELNESKYRIGRLVDVGDMILSNNPTRVFADEAWRLAKEDKP